MKISLITNAKRVYHGVQGIPDEIDCDEVDTVVVELPYGKGKTVTLFCKVKGTVRTIKGKGISGI